MAQHWTSAYEVRWTPILTFARRRLELLEWLDKHTEPVAFVEQPDYIGVALLTPDLRLTVDRSRMTVDTGVSGGSIDALVDAMEGVFEVLEPKDAVLHTASSYWSSTLPGADYHEERARLAGQLTGVPTLGGFRADDASGLADFESMEHHVQVEWGVVEQDELFSRLTMPLGRARQDQPAVRLPRESRRALRGRLQEADIDVSLLVDVRLTHKVGGLVSRGSDVVDVAADTDAVGAQFAGSLFDHFWKGKGGQHELG